MDKEKLLNHVSNQDLKNVLLKALNKVSSVLNNHIEVSTDFLDPYERKNMIQILRGIDEVSFREEGGYIESERKIIRIFPYYLSGDDIDLGIEILEIRWDSRFGQISHRDCLGALLGLGIKREKIGDILVLDGGFQVIVESKISDFITYNLSKIGRKTVSVKKISSEEITIKEPQSKEVFFTISSNRLDSVIAGIFNISRAIAQKSIDSERVKLSFEPVFSSSKEVLENDLISVRGMGRAKVIEIGDVTKKGRQKVRAKIFI